MPKPVFEKVFNNFIDKIFNNIIEKIVIGVIVTTTAAIILSNVSKKIFIIGIILIFTALVFIYLLRNKFIRNKPLQEPDALIKCLEENLQKEDVIIAINEFESGMNRFFIKYPSDTAFDDLENEWSHYKEHRIQLNMFVSKLYLFLENETLNSNEAIKKLKTNYNNFAGNIRKLTSEMYSVKKYLDVGDGKLKKDIREYEPNPGYWEKSDNWVNEKMLGYVKKIRDIRKNNSLRILDIGTGTGRLVKVLCNKNDFVCLIDYDEERLSQSKNNVQKIIDKEDQIKCINSHFEKFIKKEERDKVGLKNDFDIIICSHVIQHNSTDVALDFYKIISNLLLSDGILFLLFPISKSNKEEFVVHGLEFDIVKIRKRDFIKSKSKKNIRNLDIFFKNAVGFETLDTHFLKYNDNSGYFKITREPSEEILYEIVENKDEVLAYKRVIDKGLICSIDTKYARDFSNKDNFIRIIEVVNNCLKNYTTYPKQIFKNSKITSNILSEYWLINDINNNINVMLLAQGDHYTAKRVNMVIMAHGVHNDILKKGQIPLEFLTYINRDNKKYILKKDESKSIWNLKNDSYETIASIYKTESYYSLILDNEEKDEVNIDTEELLIKQVPSMIKEKFFMNLEAPSDFIVDSEVLDGWLISYNGEVCCFARYDNDLIRIFSTESSFNEIPVEGVLSIEDHNKFPFKLWDEENIILKSLIRDKMWRLQIKSDEKNKVDKLAGKFTVLPNYIIRTIKDGDKKYFAYRDKKYNTLSRLTFNNLCGQQMEGLKILPTHRFIISNLIKDLKDEGLVVKAQTLYHSFKPKQSFIDKRFLRDKYFNLYILKRFKKFHKKFDIQDCMFVVKKK